MGGVGRGETVGPGPHFLPLVYLWAFVVLVVPLLFSVALVGLFTTLTGRQKVLGGVGLLLKGMGLFIASCGSLWRMVVPIADVSFVCVYLAQKGVPGYLLGWIPLMCTALVALGLGVSRTKALGRWSLLPLLGGAIGLISYATDFGNTDGLFLAYFAFSVLFGLSWVALGYLLWRPLWHPSCGASFSASTGYNSAASTASAGRRVKPSRHRTSENP